MKKLLVIIFSLLLLVACSGETKEKDGIPYDNIKEVWNDKNKAFNRSLDLGDLNEEHLTRIGDEPNLLFGVDDPENVTQIEIISRNGYTAENMDEMIAIMSVLIMTLNDEITTSIDDIEYIRNWLTNNENKNIDEHSFRVDGDIYETHYIFAYINNNKE